MRLQRVRGASSCGSGTLGVVDLAIFGQVMCAVVALTESMHAALAASQEDKALWSLEVVLG